ncbi:MAG TPA: outer membrane protein assembly factor BamA [Methylomirabilota bacterium]|nr:outer membrane protein assembly factor BamA [Methylomirabilota bacterium]
MTSRGRVRRSCAVVLATIAVLIGLAEAQAPPGGPPAQTRAILIRELAVEGSRRVQEAVILGRVRSAVGSPFSPSQTSEDLRNIFSLGFFDDVQLKVEDFEGGVKVTFVVTERPFVRDVEFTGNSKLSVTDLQEKIDLKLGSVYNPVEVQRAREKLKDAYEDDGYFEVQISAEVEKFSDGDVKVVFTINEGRQIKIDAIVIRGNKGLSAKLVKSAMLVQERQFFILRGTVQRQKLEEDIDRIVGLYQDFGYVQMRVERYDIAVDREKARVTITIDVVEGAQYKVGNIKLTGVTLVPEEEVRRQLGFKTGEVFSRTKLHDGVRNISDLYSTIGRASVDVLPRTDQQAATTTMDIILDVTEGPEVYVERINITGNTRSEDRILRREIPFVEGDLFTLQKLQRAKQRLINLGYFEMVNLTTQPGTDKSRIIVNVEVTERPTGIFSIGGGFSSVDSFVGTLDIAQNNFLGRGWQLSLRIRAGANTQQGIISFTEPWLFDRPLSAGFDLFNVKRQYTEYDYDSLGGTLRLSHPFQEYWRWQVAYRLTRDDISHVRDINDPLLAEEAGKRTTSAITLGLTRDSRDNILLPTKGGYSLATADIAGVGGDSKFIKLVASTSYFYPVWYGHILSGHAEAGYGFGWMEDGLTGREELPVFERFYLGGPNSIRSFKARKISPVNDAGIRIGGTSEVLGNVEYIVPLPFNLRLAGFFDIGNVYGFKTKFDLTDLREAVGAGVRWQSPFGPIRVDYGINVDRRKGEDFGAIQFSVGSPF